MGKFFMNRLIPHSEAYLNGKRESKKDLSLVLIEWVDSFGCSSEWQKLEVHDPKPLICQSVGWLLHDSDECKVIVPHRTKASQDGVTPQGCGDMTIPTCSIISMKEIMLP